VSYGWRSAISGGMVVNVYEKQKQRLMALFLFFTNDN